MENTKKQLYAEYLIKAVEILTGIIVGVIVYKISDDDSTASALLSIVVGLLTSLIIVILVESFKQQSDIKLVKNTYEKLISIITDGKNNADEKLSYILKYGVVNFTERHMPVVWRELLWNVEKTYFATNYIKNDEIYDQSWSEAALAIQKAKAFGEHVDIKKVFIVDDMQELESLESTLKAQIKSGVNVRYILKEKLDNSRTLMRNPNKITSIDFGVFDNKSVFIWKLKERSFTGGEVKFKADEIKAYKDFFNQLYLESSILD